MPRQTRPERLNNPLRQLRGILANPPDNKPLTQAQFAGITDVPLDSVRGIEAGRQAFSSRMQNRIRCETAAAWNEQDQRWRFWKRDGPTYRREHYLKFRELIGRDVEDARRLDIFLAALRIKLLRKRSLPKHSSNSIFDSIVFWKKIGKNFVLISSPNCSRMRPVTSKRIQN